MAVVLSAQATDIGVNAATADLFKQVQTPQQMLDLGEAQLIQHIKKVGLFRSKAKYIMTLSQILVDKHGGDVPNNRDSLQQLPGVGRKTANVVLNTAFNQHTIAVDTHIFRVSNRTGLATGKTVDEVEAGLQKAVPPPFKKNAHLWLILLGRYTCRARKPLCGQCAVLSLCQFANKNLEDKSV